MCYLQHRKERIGFLLMLVFVSLLWPLLAKVSVDAKEFGLYVVGFLVSAVPLYYARKRIVNTLKKLPKAIVYSWVLRFAMTVFATGIVVLLMPYTECLLQGDIHILGHLYLVAIPCIGAYLFEIKKPALVLLITMILLAGWSALSGIILGVCICLAALPTKAYPLTLEELLTLQEVPENVESESLYIFTCLAKKKDIIPTLEKYTSHRSDKFLAYHYLLHMSHSLESKERFKCRVLEAEATLGLSEIDILFPEPRFRNLQKD